jgi:long-chain fatty acid transport protein
MTRNNVYAFGSVIQKYQDFYFGLTINKPYTTKTAFPSDDPTSYSNLKTNLDVVNVQPDIAWKQGDITYAAGLNIYSTDGLLKNRLDNTKFPESAYGIGNELTVKGSSTDLGYHLGIQYKMADNAFAGLAYYSPFTAHMKGSSYTSTGGFYTSNTDDTKADIRFPGVIRGDFIYAVKKYWIWKLTALYSSWSRQDSVIFENTALILPSTGNPIDINVLTNLHDTVTWVLANKLYFSKETAMTSFFMYDPSPTNQQDRGLITPEDDKIIIGVGLWKKLTKDIAADFTLATYFASRATLDNTNSSSNTMVGETRLNYAFALSAKFTFER